MLAQALMQMTGSSVASVIPDSFPFAPVVRQLASAAGDQPIESLLDSKEGQSVVLRALLEAKGLSGLLDAEALLSMNGKQASTLLTGAGLFKPGLKNSPFFGVASNLLKMVGDRSLSEALSSRDLRDVAMSAIVEQVSSKDQQQEAGTPVYAYRCTKCKCRFLICSSDEVDRSAEQDIVSCPVCSLSISAYPKYGRAFI